MKLYNTQEKFFKAVYIIGILAGIALIVGVLVKDPWSMVFVSSWNMLLVPTLYILLLFFLCFTKPWWKYSGEIAGTKVQTAGYLYTLIGVIIAMLQFNNESFSINEAISPIGAALLTSLLGWFLGSFIGDDVPNGGIDGGKAFDDKYTRILEEAAKKTLSAIGRMIETQIVFIDKLEVAQTKYINAIEKGTKEFETVKASVQPIREAFESVKDLSGYLSNKEALKSAKALPEGIKELNENLKKASKNSEDIANLMKGIEDLVDQYNNLMKQLDERI